MPGTDLAYGVTSLRACYAISGNAVVYWHMGLSLLACSAMSGNTRADRVISLCACYVKSDTDVACGSLSDTAD
eukprot:2624732-Rhodomonas_salina.3